MWQSHLIYEPCRRHIADLQDGYELQLKDRNLKGPRTACLMQLSINVLLSDKLAFEKDPRGAHANQIRQAN